MSISYGQLKTRLFASEGKPVALVLENGKKQLSVFIARLRLSSTKDLRQRNDFFDADIYSSDELAVEQKALLRRELEKHSLSSAGVVGPLRTPYTTIYGSSDRDCGEAGVKTPKPVTKRIRFRLCNSKISLGGSRFSVAAVLGRDTAEALLSR